MYFHGLAVRPLQIFIFLRSVVLHWLRNERNGKRVGTGHFLLSATKAYLDKELRVLQQGVVLTCRTDLQVICWS